MPEKLITRTVTVLSPKALELLRNGTKQHSDFYCENGMLRSDLSPEYIQVFTLKVRANGNDFQDFIDREKNL